MTTGVLFRLYAKISPEFCIIAEIYPLMIENDHRPRLGGMKCLWMVAIEPCSGNLMVDGFLTVCV